MKSETVVAGLLALFGAHAANAATCTWTGSGADNNWSSAANWSSCGGSKPNNGDSLVFPDGAARLVNNNDLAAFSAAHLQVDGIDYVIGGAAISLSGGIGANVPAGAIKDKSPQLALDIRLLASQTFQSSGPRPVVLKGTLDLNAHKLTVDGNTNVTIQGNIIGSGGIDKNGVGSLFLSGPASTYSGATTINSGTVIARSDNALGATGSGNDCVVLSGASLLIGAHAHVAEKVALAGSGFGGQGALGNESGDNTIDGDLFVNSIFNAAISNTVADTTLTVGGIVSGTGTLTKGGAGTVRMANVNTNSGSTIVAAGTLDVTGVLGAVTVNSGGTLSGTGVVGNIALKSGAAVSPGGRPGTIDAGLMTWNGGGVLALELGPSASRSDLLQLSGPLSKGTAGTFSVAFGDAATPPVPGVTYTLIAFPSTDFSVGDFSFSYVGTGPGASMDGAFELTATELRYTPATVVSDLILRDGYE